MSATGNRRRTTSKDDYMTPPELYDALLLPEFGFTLDAAAEPANAKCTRYLTGPCNGGKDPHDPCTCGLHADYGREVVWCNPPYGHGIGAWVGKFAAAAARGAHVVALLPANTDNLWYGRIDQTAAEIRFMYPRVQFIHPPACPCEGCAKGGADRNTGGNLLAIWRPYAPPPRPLIWWWYWRPAG